MYGVFAALGLIAALWLSLKTAVLAGLDSERLWDAGLFAVVSAFVVSRVTLIVGDMRAFVRVPVAMLELPSFTYVDAALTAVAVVAYLRWKRVPLLRALDAWAPCGAALGALLSLGQFFEGADAGMPTRLPWGTVVPGSAGLMHLQPVAIYSALAWLLLLVVLMMLLQRRPLPRHGMVAGVGLVVGGVVSFLLDMLTQPSANRAGAWLDPVQWMAVGAMLVGGLMLMFLKEIV